ncbi:MAG: hypothetical protein AB7H88_07925 [Vicinamibacterales bacterium]
MELDVGALLHLLAHELRAPASVAQGYLRMLREDRLGPPAERERAIAQAQAAIARVSELTHQASALADLLDGGRPAPVAADLASVLAEAVAHTDLDEPVHVPMTATRVRLTRPDQVARALAALIDASARPVRGRAPALAVRRAGGAGAVDVLIGPADAFAALAAGPDADTAAPLPVDRGGFGLALLLARVVLDAEGARAWTLAGTPAALAVRLQEDPTA